MEESFVKIINATYSLLEFFPDNDPLKYKAKEKTLDILENLTLVSDMLGWTSLKDYLSTDKQKAAGKLLDDIEIMTNYLKLGRNQGWVGGINFLILIKEYHQIKSQVLVKVNSKPQSQNDRRSFIGSEQNLAPENNTALMIEKVKQHSEANKGPLPPKIISLPETFESHEKISERQGKILNIILKKEKAQVSDIIKEIPNITKRTIRRDLDELLKKAKIIRKGEWNKVFYQLK